MGSFPKAIRSHLFFWSAAFFVMPARGSTITCRLCQQSQEPHVLHGHGLRLVQCSACFLSIRLSISITALHCDALQGWRRSPALGLLTSGVPTAQETFPRVGWSEVQTACVICRPDRATCNRFINALSSSARNLSTSSFFSITFNLTKIRRRLLDLVPQPSQPGHGTSTRERELGHTEATGDRAQYPGHDDFGSTTDWMETKWNRWKGLFR